MDEKDQIIEEIKALVGNAEQMKPNEFREALAALAQEGEDEEEAVDYVLIQYLNETKLNPDVRIEMIHAAGQLQHSSFLVPLKKIIDLDQHSRIRQEAITAVAKFNDRRALNILSQAQQKINNPLLLRTINEEISRIKENNPILALLPRFQEGQKNPKSCKSAIQVLKNILTPNDVTIFTKFLNSPDPLLQNGAYEILCAIGDIFHDAEILEFYQNRFRQIPCIDAPECEDLYLLTYQLRQYLSRYHFLIEEQIPLLKQQVAAVKDIRVKQLLLSLICKSNQKESIEFTRGIYHRETKSELKLTIVNELSGNEAAADFLFEIYHAGVEQENLKTAIIKSLLNIKPGLDYFVREFFRLKFEDQELIVQNLPYASRHDLVEFIKQIFKASIYRLKEILLSKVKETYEFSVMESLFAPEHEREFYFMGDEYLDTITRLFPVTSVKKLFEKIAAPELSPGKIKEYLVKISQVVSGELIYNFRDKDFITTLFNKIIRSNNLNLNMLFLDIFKNIKTLDTQTYRNLKEGISLFITQREAKITPAETGELTRIKRSLNDLNYEIQRIEDGSAILGRLTKKRFINFDQLRELLIRYPLAVIKNRDTFISYLSHELETTPEESLVSWIAFLTEFPRITRCIKSALEARVEDTEGVLLAKELAQLGEALTNDPLRIVLNFKNRGLTAVLREQFQEIDPGIPVVIDEINLKPPDILLCDPEVLRDLILKSRALPEKIYLFLEVSSGYSEFKSYNTKNFVHPFAFYRIVKEILQRFYI